ncbi:MAG: hypothetical protein KDD69_02015 [Bdellovibrionales bacterium]|nr:hypothetical protein [Bdellovibrionales bacterium]
MARSIGLGTVRSLSVVVLAAGVAASGCAQNAAQRPQLNKTGVGAATGAALGAVGGALIGSTTGDAGQGMVLGSVTGAMAGGAVGYGLQRQDEQIAQQKEVISQQSAKIDQQGRELQQLRGGALDDAPIGASGSPRFQMREESLDVSQDAAFGSPSTPPAATGLPSARSATSTFGAVEPIGGIQPTLPTAASLPEVGAISAGGAASAGFSIPEKNRRSVELTGTGLQGTPEPFDIRANERSAASEEARSRMGAPLSAGTRLINPGRKESHGATASSVTKIDELPDLPPIEVPSSVRTEPTVAKIEPVAKVESRTKTTAGGLPEAKAVRSADSALDAAPADAEAESMPVVSVVESKNTNDVLKPSDSNCLEGEAEAERARNASSDADKLFYFRRALRLCPKEPVYRIEIGRVYSGIGRTEDARFEFTKALELDPDNEIAQDELSMLMLQSQNAY